MYVSDSEQAFFSTILIKPSHIYITTKDDNEVELYVCVCVYISDILARREIT